MGKRVDGEKQRRLLVIWGKYDLSFDPDEPERYRKDVPNAQGHVLDAGHFALDTAADEIAALVRDFSSSRPGFVARHAVSSLLAPSCKRVFLDDLLSARDLLILGPGLEAVRFQATARRFRRSAAMPQLACQVE